MDKVFLIISKNHILSYDQLNNSYPSDDEIFYPFDDEIFYRIDDEIFYQVQGDKSVRDELGSVLATNQVE